MTLAAGDIVGPPPGAKVRLSSNESAFGPSLRATEAMQAAVAESNRYPDDQSLDLRAAIADHEGVPLGQVIVGTGSAGLLMDLIAEAVGPGDETIAFERAFVVYRLGTQVAGGTFVEAPCGPNFSRDPQAMLDLVTDATRLVLVDNPGNPTGDHLDGDAVRTLVEGMPAHVTIVIDEAYHQFAAGQRGYATVAELGLTHPRLIVSRTFSKAYALAGLRVGYVIGPEELLRPIDQRRARFNVNAVGQAAAIASLADHDKLEDTVRRTIAGRTRMADGLRALGIDFTDGLGNFLLVDCGRAAADVVIAFGEHDEGVGVRPLLPYGLDQHIRVSVGNEDEVEAFLRAAADIFPVRSG